MSIRLISAYLGHSSLETTAIYMHLTTVNAGQAREALERLRPAMPPLPLPQRPPSPPSSPTA